MPCESWYVSQQVSSRLFLSPFLFFFSVCLAFALWETLKGLCYKLQSLPWWPALTDSSCRGLFIAGARESMKECICMQNRECLCVCGCILHLSMYMGRSSFWAPAWAFIFLVEGLLWCLSQWHRQINQGRVNLSRAISAEPSTVLQVCLFILHVSFEPPAPNTHGYIWTYITQEKEGNRRKLRLSAMKKESMQERLSNVQKKTPKTPIIPSDGH